MSSIDFDEVLVHVGEKGRYQNIMYYLLCIPATLPAAFLAFSQVGNDDSALETLLWDAGIVEARIDGLL